MTTTPIIRPPVVPPVTSAPVPAPAEQNEQTAQAPAEQTNIKPQNKPDPDNKFHHQEDKTKMEMPAKNPNEKEYYSRVDGAFYVFKDGHKANFYGGVYATDIASEIEELEELCSTRGQYLFNKEPVPCRHSEGQVLKEVGGGPQHSGVVTGMGNSANLIGMTVR